MSDTRSTAPDALGDGREPGFTKVPTTVLGALSTVKLSGREWNLVMVTLRRTLGWHKKEDWISLSQFEEATGIDRTGVCRCLKSLVDKRILLRDRGVKRPRYRINTDTRSWACLRICAVADSTTGSGENDNQVVANPPLTKDTITKDTQTKGSAPPVSDDTEALSLARLLREKILENKPDRKQPNVRNPHWLKRTTVAIDKMIRLDRRDPGRIEDVIRWCQADNEPRGSGGFCWAPNILSGDKLRKQFDRLEIDMGRHGGDESGVPGEQELRERWERMEEREREADRDSD